jgi:hypothetical protein
MALFQIRRGDSGSKGTLQYGEPYYNCDLQTVEWGGCGGEQITLVKIGANSGSVSFTGDVTASYFVGDGSRLTNIGALQVFPFTGSAIFSGSISVTGSIYGNLVGSASYATTASYALNSLAIVSESGYVFPTTQYLKFVRLNVSSSDDQIIVTRPSDTSITYRPSNPIEGDEWTDNETFITYVRYDGYWVEKSGTSVAIPVFSGSVSFTTGSSVSASYAVTASLPLRGIITASAVNTTITFTKGDGTQFNVTVSQSGSIESASYAIFAESANSSSYALTASYALNGGSGGNFATQSIYTHYQSTLSSLWEVTHSLSSSYPIVTVYGGNNNVIIPDEILVTSADALSITFPTPVSGAASIVGNIIYAESVVAESASYALTASYVLNGGSSDPFPYTGSAIISGSLVVTGSVNAYSFTGSLFGTASQAVSASYAATASYISTNIYDLGDVSGAVSVDLSLSTNFKCRATNNITSFTCTNIREGATYIIEITTETSAKTIAFQSGVFSIPLGVVGTPQLTNCTTNGTSPAKAIDLLTLYARSSTRLVPVITPDVQDN